MADLRVHRLLLLVISLTKSLESTRLLSELKTCGDLECETLISRVLATRDYRGPDCRYLNFTKGEEISVYVKLAGGREDLWAGSKGKDFGYFPKDAVQIEEVFISEEVQVSTKESDFLCLFGLSYIFENEDSEVNSDYDETIFPYEEDKDNNFQEHESDFQIKSEFYSTSESTWLEDQVPATGTLDDVRSTRESTFWEEIEAETLEQDPVTEEEEDQIPEVDLVPPSASVPEARGWFGSRREQAEGKAIESMIAPLQDSSLQSRKMAMVAENSLEELNNDEPQVEYKQEPNSEFDSLPKKLSELASESEHILKPQATGWFGGGFTSYLGFGDEDMELELLSKESNQPLQDVPNPISSDEEPTVPCTETLVEKEDSTTSNSSSLNSNWFDFGFGMLGFAYASEDKIMSDDRKNEGDRSNKHEQPPVSKFGSDKEEETELIKFMETEDQTDKKRVLKDTDDSDTLPYFKKFLSNFDNPWKFQNIPKETELYPKQILDEDNIIENDETEEFSAENYPTDMHFMRIHEEVHSKTPSPKNDEEKPKISLAAERHTQVEVNGFVENTLSSPDNPMSSQNYIPQKEDVFEFQKYLFQIDVYGIMNSAISPIVILKERALK